MKNLKIQRLWLLVACCLVGINTFQGYWLWRQYVAQQHNFSVTVTGALAQAVQQMRMSQTSQLLSDLDPANLKGVNIQNGRIRLEMEGSDTAVSVNISHFMREILADQQLHNVDSLFSIELHKRGIREAYQLDTFSRRTPTMTTSVVNTQKSKIDVQIRTEDRVFVLIDNKITPDTGRYIRATAPLNLGKKTFVEARFPRHNYHVLAAIAGQLIASLLLMLLTAGAFFYLLYIIGQQKKLAALKSDFLSAMTHELQTPIATSAAAIEALQRFNALEYPERAASYLDIAQTQLAQLSGMVDQTLRLAAEEREGFPIQLQPIDLNALIPPMLERVRLAADREVQLHFDNQLNALVNIDPEHFSWAVQNLLDNAVKYCPKDRTPAVTVRAEAAGEGRWRLLIADNGTGIGEVHRARLFERFYRVPTEGNVKGFGLGLYVAQRIAEGHGGHIELRESTDAGSTFSIEIP